MEHDSNMIYSFETQTIYHGKLINFYYVFASKLAVSCPVAREATGTQFRLVETIEINRWTLYSTDSIGYPTEHSIDDSIENSIDLLVALLMTLLMTPRVYWHLNQKNAKRCFQTLKFSENGFQKLLSEQTSKHSTVRLKHSASPPVN